MTPLYRLKLKPTAPWRTPWQADTLTGMLLATAARTRGQDTLRERLIDPMLGGRPPFVISDALPGDLLPFPIHLRLSDWPEGTSLKGLKRARWLSPDDFQSARAGRTPPPGGLLADSDVFHDETRQHNTLSRVSDTSFSSDEGGGIYQRPEVLLRSERRSDRNADPAPKSLLAVADYLSVYIRILDRSIANLLLELFHQLSLTGFGADTSTGRGQFDLPADPELMPRLDDPPLNANGVVTLSTFQPGPTDPTDGYWDAFPKFGKLGPDLGLKNAAVHKNTLILFRPGACFRADPSTQLLGRAIRMEELLPPDTSRLLTSRDLNIIHPAFGLAVPLHF